MPCDQGKFSLERYELELVQGIFTRLGTGRISWKTNCRTAVGKLALLTKSWAIAKEAKLYKVCFFVVGRFKAKRRGGGVESRTIGAGEKRHVGEYGGKGVTISTSLPYDLIVRREHYVGCLADCQSKRAGVVLSQTTGVGSGYETR